MQQIKVSILQPDVASLSNSRQEWEPRPFPPNISWREGSGEAHYSGRRETEKGLRFVLAELGFLAGFLAVGRCPGRKSVDCAKLAVIRRSQEAQLDEDKGFKMKLDSVIHLNRLCKGIFLGSYFCSFLFTVRPSVCTDNSKMFFFSHLEITITCFVPHTACFFTQRGVCNKFDTKTSVGEQKLWSHYFVLFSNLKAINRAHFTQLCMFLILSYYLAVGIISMLIHNNPARL